MATDKTPTHKRISRAENSSMQWKMKAIERREAAERLKEQLETEAKNVQSKNAELDAANKRCADLLTLRKMGSEHIATSPEPQPFKF